MTEAIQDVLRRLRQETTGAQAPDALEGKLLEAFRAHHAPKGTREAERRYSKRRVWVSAAIAASVTIALAWQMTRTVTVQAPSAAPVAENAKPGILKNEPKTGSPIPTGSAANSPSNGKPSKRRAPPQRQPKLRLAGTPVRQTPEFIEIPYAPAFDPLDGGQVVRVNMRGSAVRRLGLPVMTDRVQADVLLGEDGIARAIRLISTSGLNSKR